MVNQGVESMKGKTLLYLHLQSLHLHFSAISLESNECEIISNDRHKIAVTWIWFLQFNVNLIHGIPLSHTLPSKTQHRYSNPIITDTFQKWLPWNIFYTITIHFICSIMAYITHWKHISSFLCQLMILSEEKKTTLEEKNVDANLPTKDSTSYR